MEITNIALNSVKIVQKALEGQAQSTEISQDGKKFFKAILFLREYLDYDALLKDEFTGESAPSPLLPAAVKLINGETEEWDSALDAHLGQLTESDKQAFITLFNLGIEPTDLDARTISEEILLNKYFASDMSQVLAIINNYGTLSSKATSLFRAIIYLREYLDYDALLKDEFTGESAPSPLLPAAVKLINGETEEWDSALDAHLGQLTESDKQAFITLFNLGIEPTDLDARTISEEILTQKDGSDDLIAALCRLDGSEGFCPPSISSADPNTIPAETPTEIIITGANLPILHFGTYRDANQLTIIDQEGAPVSGAAIELTGATSGDQKKMIVTVNIPVKGKYFIRVSDETNRLSAVAQITVTDAESLASLTVEPQTVEAGEPTSIYVTLSGIEKEALEGKTLTLDVRTSGGASLLDQASSIILNTRQITEGNPIIIGTKINIDGDPTDPLKNVSIKVAGTATEQTASLCLFVDGVEVASTPIGISNKGTANTGPKENKWENASDWMRKYLNPTPTLSMIFANEAGGKDANPLAESVLRAPEPYNIGLRLNPTIGITEWVDLTLDAGATAQFDHAFDLRRSDYVAGSGLGLNLGPITIGGSYGAKYFDSDTTTPSLSTPYDTHHTQTMEGYARLRSDSWETKIFYRHNWMDYTYNDEALLGEHFSGKGKTDEFGGEFKLKHQDANLTVGGSYFTGSREVYDTYAVNPEKDINGGSIYANLLLPSIWSDPYLNLLYSGAHDGGSLKQYLFSARLGADLLPSFWGNQKNILEFLFYANRETGYIDAQALGLGLSWKPEYLPTLSFTWERQEVDAPIISEDSQYNQFIFGVDLAPMINDQIKEK